MEEQTGSTVALTEAKLPTCVLRVSRNDTTLTKLTRRDNFSSSWEVMTVPKATRQHEQYGIQLYEVRAC